jgi:hypothetical protein
VAAHGRMCGHKGPQWCAAPAVANLCIDIADVCICAIVDVWARGVEQAVSPHVSAESTAVRICTRSRMSYQIASRIASIANARIMADRWIGVHLIVMFALAGSGSESGLALLVANMSS